MASGFSIKQQLANQQKQGQGIISNMLNLEAVTKTMSIPYAQLEFGAFKKYEIDEQEVKDLAESIASLGLEQNLVVKETENPNVYIVVTGHKRLTAIRYIFDNNIEINVKVRKSIETPMCIVIPKEEDELITRFRMHETNVHQRKGFTISEVEDYLKTIEEAKERKLEVNGKQIKGTSRAILKAQFNFSEATAKKYLKVIKEGTDELKKAVNDGDITINNAYDILMGSAEPIINTPTDEQTKNDKAETIKESLEKTKDGDDGKNEEKSKPKQEVNVKKIYKSCKGMFKNINKVMDDVDILKNDKADGLPEELRLKICDVQNLLAGIEHDFEQLLKK